MNEWRKRIRAFFLGVGRRMTRRTDAGRARRAKRGAAKVFTTCFPLILAAWILLVLYPNPLRLAASVRRLDKPSVDPAAVESLAAGLPSDPVAIEAAVLDEVPYRYDWRVYGMPWYYPTVEEVLARGEGDCKARAIVLASVLEAKGIAYRIRSSPTHVWVEYEGKAETPLENRDAGLYEIDPQTGAGSFHFPRVSFVDVVGTAWQGFWPPMPIERKVLLVLGTAALAALRVVWPRTTRPATSALPEPAGVRAVD